MDNDEIDVVENMIEDDIDDYNPNDGYDGNNLEDDNNK